MADGPKKRVVNRVHVRGELIDEPELTDTKTGKRVVNLKVAVPSIHEKEEPFWFVARAYNKPADELYEAELQEGDFLDITGFLKQERWIGKASGRPESRVIIQLTQFRKVDCAYTEVPGED